MAMRKWVATKRFTFEAGHQLVSSYSAECRECVHGHSYKVEVRLARLSSLDPDGMVVDFKKIKELFKPIIDLWDHAVILPFELAGKYDSDVSKKIVLVEWNPTAENMALALFHKFQEALRDAIADTLDNAVMPDVRVESVRLQETETGWVEYSE